MRLQEAPTDQRTANGQEGRMDLGPPRIPEAPAAELMQPRERAFHDPAGHPQPTAMGRPALGQNRLGPTGPQALSGRFGVIAAIPSLLYHTRGKHCHHSVALKPTT
jgi:hypothetical protein